MVAADWTCRQLAQRWVTLDHPNLSQIGEDIRAVVCEMPVEFKDPDFGCSFSIALVLMDGLTCHVVAAGAYGIELIRKAVATSLFAPRRWVDQAVDEGAITTEEANVHPLRTVLVGPWLADGGPNAPLILGPFGLEPGSSVVIAEQRVLDQRRRLAGGGAEALNAAALQALLERPATPVVVLQV